jgi:hypothetical protein
MVCFVGVYSGCGRGRVIGIELFHREDPPVELMQRANRIISRPRVSPEMDDATVQKLRDKSRKLENEGEEDIVQQLGPYIIPAMDEVPDPRLARNTDQPWFNYVPLPLNPNVLIDPLPLPKPKPDLVLWCSWDGSLQG